MRDHLRAGKICICLLCLVLSGFIFLTSYLEHVRAAEKNQNDQARTSVLYVQIESPITPAQVDLLQDVLREADVRGATMLLIRLDTPGGLVESMREMVKLMLNGPVPVGVWVGPAGARAASAGVFLVGASNIAGMSPQTSIGAASPVVADGKDMPETMAKKVKNDLMSLIRGVVRARKRNMEWYEEAVDKSVSITGSEAVMQRVVELLTTSPEDFLAQAGARGVPFRGERIFFSPESVDVVEYEPGLRYSLLSWLLHPQIAYLLLLGGMAGLFFELTNPGTLVPGVLGGFCLLLGLYALSVLPTNAAGILLILFGLVLFLLEVKITSYGLLSVAAIVSLFVGSMILFKADQGFSALPLSMVLVTVAGLAVILGFAVYLVTQAMQRPPISGQEAMVGLVGDVRSWEGTGGQIFVQGALWSAKTNNKIALETGQRVRVVLVNGLLLTVEPVIKV